MAAVAAGTMTKKAQEMSSLSLGPFFFKKNILFTNYNNHNNHTHGPHNQQWQKRPTRLAWTTVNCCSGPRCIHYLFLRVLFFITNYLFFRWHLSGTTTTCSSPPLPETWVRGVFLPHPFPSLAPNARWRGHFMCPSQMATTRSTKNQPKKCRCRRFLGHRQHSRGVDPLSCLVMLRARPEPWSRAKPSPG